MALPIEGDAVAETILVAELGLWFRSVGLVGPERLVAMQPACLGLIPAPLPVHDADLLRILAELPHAPTIQQAAAACGLSERTLKRKVMTLREAVGIPANGLTRHRPGEVADLVWAALAVPAAGGAGTHPCSTDRGGGDYLPHMGVYAGINA